MKTVISCLVLAAVAAAEIHQNPGTATPLPHQEYVHVVSAADSPIQQTYIKSKGRLYTDRSASPPYR